MIDKIKSALNPVPVMINSEELFDAVFYKFKRESQAQKIQQKKSAKENVKSKSSRHKISKKYGTI